MYKDKIHVLVNHSDKISMLTKCLYEKGSCVSAHHKKIPFLSEVFYSEVYRMNVLSSISKEKLLIEAQKQDKTRSLLICFKGSDADFLALKDALKEQKNWHCLLLKDDVEYIVDVYWDSASQYNYFCKIVSIAEKQIQIKKEASNVNVDLPKPDNDKKTDK